MSETSGPEPVDLDLVRRLQGQVADEINRENQRREASGQPALSGADEEQFAIGAIQRRVAAWIESEMRGGGDVPVDRAMDDRLTAAVYAAMYGAGQLTSLLEDEDVENININGCDQMWITYARDSARGQYAHGRPEGPYPIAASDDDLIGLIQSLAAHQGINARPWTPVAPELDLRLKDGSRLSAVMIAGERPSISIRRNRYPSMWLSKLVELETVDEPLAAFFSAAVRARMNIMVCGATNSGKTTLLRALINEIPAFERLITVEKALELGIGRHPEDHPNVVEWETVLPDAEGQGGLTMAQLVRRSLRQDPDRVIVGEVLGEEIVVMLSAMSQGNDGSLSTIHARSAIATLDRIASYAAQAEGLSFEVTHSLIHGAIDFIVFVRQNPLMGGRRTVSEVVEIAGFDGERVTPSQLWVPGSANGRAVRDVDVPMTEDRRKRLQDAGYNDTDYFGTY